MCSLNIIRYTSIPQKTFLEPRGVVKYGDLLLMRRCQVDLICAALASAFRNPFTVEKCAASRVGPDSSARSLSG
jgi:predicted component of type VI protein secretion system